MYYAKNIRKSFWCLLIFLDWQSNCRLFPDPMILEDGTKLWETHWSMAISDHRILKEGNDVNPVDWERFHDTGITSRDTFTRTTTSQERNIDKAEDYWKCNWRRWFAKKSKWWPYGKNSQRQPYATKQYYELGPSRFRGALRKRKQKESHGTFAQPKPCPKIHCKYLITWTN